MSKISRRELVKAMAVASLGSACASKPMVKGTVSNADSAVSENFHNYQNFSSARRWLDTEYGRIAYVDHGVGPVAVFLHGLGLNGYYWVNQLIELSRNRRCIAIDLMAHGYTDTAVDQDVSFTAQAEMVLTIIDKLEIDTFDLVGSDSGGAIAQIIATKQPGRIKSLVLTNCDVHDNWPPPALEAMRASAPNGALAENFAAIVKNPQLMRAKGGLAELVFENPSAISDELTKIFLDPIVRSTESRAAFNRYVGPQDTSQLTRIESDLKRLQVPCLILWATNDIFFGIEWAYWLKNTLPMAREVIEFEGAKLFFPFERADRVNREISAFWSSIEL